MSLIIPRRYNGPDNSGNGGYCAGRFAQAFEPHTDQAVTVRLLSPPPLETPLGIKPDEQGALVVDGDTPVARVSFAELRLNLPDPCSLQQATEASRHYAGFEQHPFPRCYVCGPQRATDDGLRIFPGGVAGSQMVAAPWQPFPATADENGHLAVEQIWAALDCPSYFGATLDQPLVNALLGSLTLQIFQHQLRPAETYLICAWPNGQQGRKYHGGAVLFDLKGQRLAAADAIWITLPQ